MKKILLCLLTALTLLGCAKKGMNGNVTQDVEIPTPFIEVSSKEEAEKEIGFHLTVPEEINENTPSTYLIYKDLQMIEVQYLTSNEDKYAYIRKAKDNLEDISGNYNSYSLTKEEKINDFEVIFKLNDDKVYTAEWKNDGYSYCLNVQNGLDENEFKQLISIIH